MALKVQRCLTAIDHVLGDGPDARLDTLSLVNEAGEHLVNLAPWRFLERQDVKLATVASQAYIEPPELMREIDAIQPTGGTTGLVMTNLEKIQALRAGSTTYEAGSGEWYAAIALVQDVTTKEPKPRIELYPTPNASTADVFRMNGRAAWQEVSDPDDYIFVPGYAVPLMIHLCRLVAAAYEEHDLASLEDRLDRLRQSTVYLTCLSRDGALQTKGYGRIKGGHAQYGGLSSAPRTGWGNITI